MALLFQNKKECGMGKIHIPYYEFETNGCLGNKRKENNI